MSSFLIFEYLSCDLVIRICNNEMNLALMLKSMIFRSCFDFTICVNCILNRNCNCSMINCEINKANIKTRRVNKKYYVGHCNETFIQLCIHVRK